MAITFNAPPRADWAGALEALGQGFGQQQERNRQQQEGQILDKVLQSISQKGQDVQAYDIIRSLAQAQAQGVSPQSVHAYGELIPKLQTSTARSSGLDPQLLAAQAEMRKAQAEEHKQALDLYKPILNEIDAKRLSAPRINEELELAKEAILSNNIGWWSPSHVAEIFHMPGLLTPEGKLAKNAMKSQYKRVKEFFGGNPSDFETKQIDDMLVKIGADENANMVAYAILKAENDMDNLAIASRDKILKENGGQIPIDFGEKLSREMDRGRKKIKDDTRQIINYAASRYYTPEKEPKKLGYNSSLLNRQSEGTKGEQRESLGKKQEESAPKKRKVRHKASQKIMEVGPEYFEEVSSRPRDYEFVE